MKAIEATATVTPDRTLTVDLPVDLPPGQHQVVIVIDETPLTVITLTTP